MENDKTKKNEKIHFFLLKNFQGFLVYWKLRSYLSIAKWSNENDNYTIKELLVEVKVDLEFEELNLSESE